MKTLKYLTICLALCCLFTGNVFAQCVVGIAPSISGELDFCGSGVQANNASIGQTIVYSVLIETSGAACPISDAVATLTLPDGTVVPVPVSSDLPPGTSEFFPCIATYVVAAEDLGQLAVDISPGGTDPTQSNEVRALVSASGTADTGDGNTDEAQGAAVRTTTIIAEPCVEITKDACGYSKAGDVITYTYTLENCTIPIGDPPGPDLTLVDVIDDILGDLTGDALAACGPTLVWGAPPCEFTVDYLVSGADEPGPIVNVVTVNAVEQASGIGTSDTATETVELLHPDFTVDVECLEIVGNTALFEVTFVNTGDVDLEINSQNAQIGSFPLAEGATAVFVVEESVLAVCGAGTATLTVTPLATIPVEFCDLPNVITPDPTSDTATCLTTTNPSFTVDKTCTTTGPLTEGDIAQYQIIVTNTGDVPLDFEINDADAEPPIVGDLVGPILPGLTYQTTVSITVPACAETGVDYFINNLVSVEGFCAADGTSIGTQTADADCTYSCDPVGGEGCTPGFWKNNPDCWCDSYNPGDPVAGVFTALQDPNYAEIDDSKSDFDEDSLLDALKYGGGRGLAGATRNLLRHATAALLNGCSSDVLYPVSDGTVIDLVNAALATEDVDIIQELHGVLAGFNEDSPCPISADNAKEPCQRYEEPVDPS